jgi:poly-gamma-glutamate synthesis protein (capsule biosynthesis protein)
MKKNISLLILTIVALAITVGLYASLYFNKKENNTRELIDKSTIKNGLSDSVSVSDTVIKESSTINKKEDISLESVFNYINPDHKSIAEEGTYTIIATGDIIAGRSVNYLTTASGNFSLPYEKTADLMKSSDITFVNFESPLIKNCPITVDGMIFCGDERNIEGLKFSGVDIANFANNHIGNFGLEGIENTVKVFDSNNILYTGLGDPAILDIRGKKFGFLGFNEVADAGPYVSDAKKELIQQQIEDLRGRVDFVIVAFHWGIEYTLEPSESQRNLAYLAVDSGADLIIGNHPHWVQGVEMYKGKFISYAHGNFIFDQMWSRETREGVIGKYVFDDGGLTEVGYYPVIIENYNQPRFATEEEAKVILDRMRSSSNL